jgi:hypothetical protein
LTFRIIFTSPLDQVTYILAVSDEEKKINNHWDQLWNEILPVVCSVRQAINALPSDEEKSKVIQEALQEDDVVRYLFSKVNGFSQVR